MVLPNGQTIIPAGTHIEVNDRRLAIAVSPDGTQATVTIASNFDSRALYFINLATQSIAQTIPINNSFVGLAFTADADRGCTILSSMDLLATRPSSLAWPRSGVKKLDEGAPGRCQSGARR